MLEITITPISRRFALSYYSSDLAVAELDAFVINATLRRA